ncbi:MAG: winged helix DNA-binding domain-containing protein [Anaerolineae bacterium]|nr:winged helix DNA-binding domain-containing protein [Anaerolineae bacterium]
MDRVNRFLLNKQHLEPETQGNDDVEVVKDICALHATAALTPYLSLWSRVREFCLQQLDAELYERRRLVRILCMRGTLHAPEHHDQVFDRAGNAFATVWVNGRVVGVWREREAAIELLVWRNVESEVLAAEAKRLGRFLVGEDVGVVIKPYPAEIYVKNPFTLAPRH